IDANFRLKRKHVSSDDRDPDISQGFAYFVEEKKYKEYLKKNEHFVELKSTCSRHNAVNLSNAKPGVSHAATGVGTVECARHNMKWPNAVGDLQFGERLRLQELYVSYDICCQWSIHLRDRMLELDHNFFLHDNQVYVKFAVPKFHLPAHVERCRTSYSLNFTVGAARTNGEAPERGWAEVNPLASSTKEMGPGSRRDCTTLYRKAKAAASDMAEHTIVHEELTSTLPQATITQWTTEVEAWEQTQDHPLSTASSKSSISNPYYSKVKQASAVWDHAKDQQKTKLQLRTNALSRKLTAWAKCQQLYMPAMLALRRNDNAAASTKSTLIPLHDYALWLPSACLSKIQFDRSLAEIEWDLRLAQANEALEGLKRNLQI
ncbi:hypothetical protein H0H92_004999, partial [Tricholoma furcatifolium]